MAKKKIILIKHKKKDSYVDLNGRTCSHPKFKRPTFFKSCDKAQNFIIYLVSQKKERKKENYCLSEMNLIEYFEKYYPDNNITNASSLVK